jgi:hypothetical protein
MSTERTRGVAESALDRELAMIRQAIDMVASGGAPRVTLGGLRFGEQLLGRARRLGAVSGVRVVPLYSTDEAGADLMMERIDA